MESSGLKAQSEARDRRRSMVALSVNRSPSAQTHRSSPKATQPVKAGDPSGSRIRGKTGQYLKVLNTASEKGLSLETCGREWLRVMFRSVSKVATFLEVIEVPLSAWM